MTDTPAPRRNLATARELADYCGVPLGTVYQWSHRGGGPRMIKVGRHLRARWSDIEQWLDAQTQQRHAYTAEAERDRALAAWRSARRRAAETDDALALLCHALVKGAADVEGADEQRVRAWVKEWTGRALDTPLARSK